MASNNLTGDACGAQNPLMQFAGHMTQDRAFRQEGISFGNLSSGVPEAPRTFQMDKLLQNIEELQGAHGERHVSSMNPTTPWHSDFEDEASTRRTQSLDVSLLRGDTELASQAPLSHIHPLGTHLFRHQQLGPDTNVQLGGQTWASKYLAEADHVILRPTDLEEQRTVSKDEDSALREAAEDFVRDIKDDDIQSTSFMDYVRQLASSVSEPNDNYRDLQALDDALQDSRSRTYEFDDEVAFWQGLEDTYRNHFLSDTEHFRDRSSTNSADRYEFSKTNEHLSDEDPFSIGQSYLREGNIPEAVLCFEAAVQKQPERAEAWERLGLVLAENEQEMDAITACQACLDLQPGNGDALLSLARSFTNEMLNRDACLALKCWLKTQPKYAHLFSGETTNEEAQLEDFDSAPLGTFGRMRTYVGKEEFNETEALLLKAVKTDPRHIDPDLQIALGILYNVSGEYSKAVDCFQTALKARNKDPLLWNKLGATLANSHRSELAVNAYQRALELAPGFVRARSNLSIACIEMGAHWQAMEQALIAINLQSKSSAKKDSAFNAVPAESIWALMRMAAMRMESDSQLAAAGGAGQGAAAQLSRQELLNLIADQNVDQLNNLFQIMS